MNPEPLPSAQKPGARIRPVPWSAEHRDAAAALPMQKAAPPEAAAPQRAPPTSPGFEELTSASPQEVSPDRPASAGDKPPPSGDQRAAGRGLVPHRDGAPARQAEPAHAPEESRELSPRLEAAIAALKAQGERLAEQARSDALEIGLLVARKVLEREITTNLDALFSLIKSAIRRAGESNKLVVRLAAIDHARVHESAESAFTLGRVELLPDESLALGDVVVETESTTVDGRLSTRLDELRRELDQSMKEE